MATTMNDYLIEETLMVRFSKYFKESEPSDYLNHVKKFELFFRSQEKTGDIIVIPEESILYTSTQDYRSFIVCDVYGSDGFRYPEYLFPYEICLCPSIQVINSYKDEECKDFQDGRYKGSLIDNKSPYNWAKPFLTYTESEMFEDSGKYFLNPGPWQELDILNYLKGKTFIIEKTGMVSGGCENVFKKKDNLEHSDERFRLSKGSAYEYYNGKPLIIGGFRYSPYNHRTLYGLKTLDSKTASDIIKERQEVEKRRLSDELFNALKNTNYLKSRYLEDILKSIDDKQKNYYKECNLAYVMYNRPMNHILVIFGKNLYEINYYVTKDVFAYRTVLHFGYGSILIKYENGITRGDLTRKILSVIENWEVIKK